MTDVSTREVLLLTSGYQDAGGSPDLLLVEPPGVEPAGGVLQAEILAENLRGDQGNDLQVVVGGAGEVAAAGAGGGTADTVGGAGGGGGGGGEQVTGGGEGEPGEGGAGARGCGGGAEVLAPGVGMDSGDGGQVGVQPRDARAVAGRVVSDSGGGGHGGTDGWPGVAVGAGAGGGAGGPEVAVLGLQRVAAVVPGVPGAAGSGGTVGLAGTLGTAQQTLYRSLDKAMAMVCENPPDSVHAADEVVLDKLALNLARAEFTATRFVIARLASREEGTRHRGGEEDYLQEKHCCY